jgi:hypothetical protein
MKLDAVVNKERLEWLEVELAMQPSCKAIHGLKIFIHMKDLYAGNSSLESKYIGSLELTDNETYINILPESQLNVININGDIN